MEGYHLPVAHKATVGAWFPVEKTVFPDEVYDAFTYQTFQKVGNATYGQAHPDNTVLEGDWRITSVLPTVFPTHMYVLAPTTFGTFPCVRKVLGRSMCVSAWQSHPRSTRCWALPTNVAPGSTS